MIKKDKTEAVEKKFSVKVLRARTIKETEKEQVISFDLEVNNITIYGMIYRSGVSSKGKDYELISFPARKGDNGTYYNHVWFGINKELEAQIKTEIEGVINNA